MYIYRSIHNIYICIHDTMAVQYVSVDKSRSLDTTPLPLLTVWSMCKQCSMDRDLPVRERFKFSRYIIYMYLYMFKTCLCVGIWYGSYVTEFLAIILLWKQIRLQNNALVHILNYYSTKFDYTSIALNSSNL